MYLVGAPHPNRDRIATFLERHLDETFVSSAEVYQEVIHRYVAIDRREAIGDCFALLDDLVQQVFPITKRDAERAHGISLEQQRLSGRDCLHLAIMERFGVSRILSCDEDFGLWPNINRLP